MDIPLKHLPKKDLIFIQGGITLSRKVNTWVFIGPAYQSLFVVTWEYSKIEESFGIRMLFSKISAEYVNSWYPYKQFSPKNPDSAMKPSSNYAIFIVYPYA